MEERSVSVQHQLRPRAALPAVGHGGHPPVRQKGEERQVVPVHVHAAPLQQLRPQRASCFRAGLEIPLGAAPEAVAPLIAEEIFAGAGVDGVGAGGQGVLRSPILSRRVNGPQNPASRIAPAAEGHSAVPQLKQIPEQAVLLAGGEQRLQLLIQHGYRPVGEGIEPVLAVHLGAVDIGAAQPLGQLLQIHAAKLPAGPVQLPLDPGGFGDLVVPLVPAGLVKALRKLKGGGGQLLRYPQGAVRSRTQIVYVHEVLRSLGAGQGDVVFQRRGRPVQCHPANGRPSVVLRCSQNIEGLPVGAARADLLHSGLAADKAGRVNCSAGLRAASAAAAGRQGRHQAQSQQHCRQPPSHFFHNA